ncbi:MAG: hypothetical protein PHN88_06005 [Ignavibacteria bacterium]|nr:hypothetical protein [Ignavibacteria bacterium]
MIARNNNNLKAKDFHAEKQSPFETTGDDKEHYTDYLRLFFFHFPASASACSRQVNAGRQAAGLNGKNEPAD